MVNLLFLFLKNFVSKNKAICILIYVLLIVSLFSVFLISAIIAGMDENNRVNDTSMRKYTIILQINIGDNIGELGNKTLDMLNKISVNSEIESARFIQINKHDENDLCGMYIIGKPTLYRGRSFTEYEQTSSQNKIIISNLQQSALWIGDSFELCGEKYDVIGLSFENVHIIPYSCVKLSSYNFEELEVLLKKAPSEEARSNILSIITDYFPETTVISPVSDDVDLDPLLVGLFLGLFFVTVINILFIYDYIIEQRIKAIKIMRICGATNLYCVVLFLFEMLIFTITAYIPVVIIAEFLIPCLLEYITDGNLNYCLNFKDIIMIFVIYIFTVILIFLPKLKKSINLISISEFER